MGQFVVFKLNDEEYAVPIADVKEIINYQVPTRIPNSPYCYKGVINLRAKLIPIIDLKLKMNMDGNIEESHRIIIVETGRDSIGFTVDEVNEVIQLKDEDIEKIQEESPYIFGIGKMEDRLIVLLDLKQLIENV